MNNTAVFGDVKAPWRYNINEHPSTLWGIYGMKLSPCVGTNIWYIIRNELEDFI
jgi:hypothetical protein